MDHNIILETSRAYGRTPRWELKCHTTSKKCMERWYRYDYVPNWSKIDYLKKIGADLDRGDHKGVSPLMWAAKRDHVEVCIVLVKAGCNVPKRSLEGFSALDYAILNGNYPSAYMLFEFDKNLLTIERYQKENQRLMLRYVDYEQFIKCLRDGIYIAKAPNLLEKPPKPVLRDPVYDRSETWGNMVKRIINFEPPPMVERAQSLQPSQILTDPAWISIIIRVFYWPPGDLDSTLFACSFLIVGPYCGVFIRLGSRTFISLRLAFIYIF